jgi:hypothetical protein
MLFGVGTLGAALVAAIMSSLAQPERGPSRQAAAFLSQHGIARVAGAAVVLASWRHQPWAYWFESPA